MKYLDQPIKSMLGDLTPTGLAWARVGVIVLCCAAAMSWEFGASISWKHAAFLACLTFVAAFGPEAAYKALNEGKPLAGIAIAIICTPLLVIEFYSHGGYTAGLRGNNLAEARVQNTKYDGAQEATKEDKTNLELWKSNLARLMEANAWAGTVKAEGLRAEIAVHDKDIALETARGGCKAKCSSLMAKKADLEKRISIAEQASDLAKQIEATQRILDRKRDVASTTEFKSSAVEHQNRSLAKWVSMIGYGTLKPTAMVEESAEQSANFMMALAGTGLPAFCLFIAGLYRRRDGSHAHEAITAPIARMFAAPPQHQHPMTPPATTSSSGPDRNVSVHVRDDRGMTDVLRLLKDAVQPHRSAAA